MKTVFACLTIAAAAFAIPGTAPAASYCKGLSESACTSTDGCKWRQQITRKDGVNVKAHCRKSSSKRK